MPRAFLQPFCFAGAFEPDCKPDSALVRQPVLVPRLGGMVAEILVASGLIRGVLYGISYLWQTVQSVVATQ